MNRLTIRLCTVVSAFSFCFAAVASESDEIDPFDLPLEQLFNMHVSTASGWDEALRDAPAAMVIITRQEINQRGYTSIAEIFQDLPGFDAINTDGSQEITAYQRGYRTPFTQRTLMAVNGVLDNHLWNHSLQTANQYPMSAIERIEVLYGPAGSVYGPNAFLGVVNIITRTNDTNQRDYFSATASIGENQTRSLDIEGAGKIGAIDYNFGLRHYTTDGPELSDYSDWGFATEQWLGDQNVWGPVLQESANGVPLGQFHNPDDDWGLLAELGYKDTRFGVILWETVTGYGVYYPFDHGQPNADWQTTSRQFYLENDTAFSDKLSFKTLLKYRISDVKGDWSEAFPDWDEGKSAFSYVSISDWNADNDSWKFREDFKYQASETLQLSGGIKYERKDLTKAYDVCNYYSDSFCSSNTDNTGPYDLGFGIVHSTDAQLQFGPKPLSNVPDANKIKTTDKGVYLQAGWQRQDWRFSAGWRWDNNSLYGSFSKPRFSAIHHFTDQTTLKLIYAEAFQEPAPQQSYGGWSGRSANPNLKPEEVQNIEMILMHLQDNWSHDISFYYAAYDNVIKEEAENAGQRHVTGIEYRGKFHFDNYWTNGGDINGNLYYSWTDSQSEIVYDHNADEWVDGDAELGDIARHKISAAINLPWSETFNISLKANWVDSRTLYLANPLRNEGKDVGGYTTVDLMLNWSFDPLSIKLKFSNLFDKQYYQPGGERANSGDDFNQRAKGFQNSLIPQLGRSWLLMLSYDF